MAELQKAKVPGYIFPESAARALGAMWRQRQRRDRPPGVVRAFQTDDAAVERILGATLAAGRSKLSEPDALRLLEAYGIPVAPWRFVSHDGQQSLAPSAAEQAAQLGFPVALKIVSPEVVHKTEVGGVVLHLQSQDAVRRAVREMVKNPGTGTVDGVLLQRMAPPGRETIVGMTRMPRAGPLVMFGLGGVYVEVLRDVVLRLSPLRDTDAREMIREVKTYRLLEGVRGEPARDLDALSDALLRVSQLAQRHPRISELDINPLLALERGAVAVDARVQLGDGAGRKGTEGDGRG
jgi:acyl-CoA synthetase (NDP forming)